MNVNPADVRSVSTVGPDDVGTVMTLHGVISMAGEQMILTEPTEDMSDPRLPIGVVIENVDHLEEGSYLVVEGNFSVVGGGASFSHVRLHVNEYEVFGPDAVDDIRSQQKAAKAIMDVLREHGEPLPARYVIERAGRLDFDREYVRDVLNKMLTGGALYSPRRGMVFGA